MPETFTENLLRRFINLVDAGSRGQRSQRAVAREIGLNHSTLSRWRKGGRLPNARSLERIMSWVDIEERRTPDAKRPS